jgi:hypothetical protein
MPPLDALLPRFGLAPGRRLPGHAPQGSPERCLDRRVVADAEGRLWLLERLHPAQTPRREALGRLLCALRQADGEAAAVVPAYQPVDSGGFVLDCGDAPGSAHGDASDGFWQLSPFVPGAPLPRPGYLRREDLGRALARVLLAVQRAAARLPDAVALPEPPEPNLPAYGERLFAALDRNRPDAAARLADYRQALRGLPEALDAFAPALAHGDLHPLNVIWGEDGGPAVRALIDWEFAGARPGPYDAANCLGCAGFEHPSGLAGGFALGFADGLREGGMQPGALAALGLLVPASRLGWLAEWLRRADEEMLAMELDYIDILLAERHRLARLWSGG